MSWFSLIQAEKSVLDSQEFFKDAITGEFFGKYAVENILKKTQLYLRVRSFVSLFFTHKLCRPLESLSGEVSEKLLERAVISEKFPKIFPELFSRFHDIAHETHVYPSRDQNPIKETSFPQQDNQPKEMISGLNDLVHHIFDEYLANNAEAYKHWVQAIENGNEDLEKFVKNAIVASLLPVCKKAVHASLKTFVKTGIDNVFDNGWKASISIVSIATIYSLAMKVFDCAGDICDDSSLNHTFRFMQNRLPSPSMALWALTAVHTAEMIKVFWKTRRLKLTHTDLNKEQVERLAINLARNPIKQALGETEVFKAMTLTFKAEKIDDFVDLFIRETIDYYWNDLHKIRFLNLPLVT